MTAINLLRQRVAAHGQAAVARELAISKTAVSQILNGKYQASTEHVEARIMKLYGLGGAVNCPHRQEQITPAECAETYNRAVAIGLKATGNPQTMRQHHACLHCPIRR